MFCECVCSNIEIAISYILRFSSIQVGYFASAFASGKNDEIMPKGMTKCKYCGEMIASVLISDHIEKRCEYRTPYKRIIHYIKAVL